ncbi:MAG: NADH-quinone oxidoreductase subunit C [Bacteroidales bacterium]|nr:NADH-quinone oxidoreductase subunit C [Bacteroidales bacterium]MDT8374135.1 NADH-quinone oxidoreductase subunit C [Bacteroidales bacterium]
MDTEAAINKLTGKFIDEIAEVTLQKGKRAIVTIRPTALLTLSEYLFKSEGFRFIIASAMHTRRGFEIYYHFSLDADGIILSLHVILDKEKPHIESLSNMFSASNWIEREMHELFGIDFLHHPNQEKLLSEGNWAEGVYPYRKEFK